MQVESRVTSETRDSRTFLRRQFGNSVFPEECAQYQSYHAPEYCVAWFVLAHNEALTKQSLKS